MEDKDEKIRALWQACLHYKMERDAYSARSQEIRNLKSVHDANIAFLLERCATLAAALTKAEHALSQQVEAARVARVEYNRLVTEHAALISALMTSYPGYEA